MIEAKIYQEDDIMHTEISTETYGKWDSPIAPTIIASKALNFGDLHVDQGKIYWTENRPLEQNRNVIVSWDKNGNYCDETDIKYHVSANVHGYGGGAFLVKNGIIYFSDALSGFIYQKNLTLDVTLQITTDPKIQYADFDVDQENKYLYGLQKNGSKTCITRISIKTRKAEMLFSGADFYSNIRISRDGKTLVWLQWNHPNMPWDKTELWCADIERDSNYKVTNARKISDDKNESFYQPEWSPDNELFVVSDRTGYWNIYKYERFSSSDLSKKRMFNICPVNADFGRPMWIAGTRCYSFLSNKKIIACCIEKGIWKTALIDLKNQKFEFIENDLSCIYNIAAKDNSIAFIAGNGKIPLSVIESKGKEPQFKIIRSSCENLISDDFISIPKCIEFPTTNDDIAHAFYYAPKNPYFHGMENSTPPLIVKVHGGPTANADFLFNPRIQYYTTRGFAYVEVNYRGSTGYGRSYREKLKNNWGIHDVDDCINCANFLCELNLSDKNNLFISGSSSGGYTLLCSLAFRDPFYKAASCLYGISDLVALSEHTHKFESFYDQGLIGADINTPEGHKLYEKRSPIHSADCIKTPIIFFHGDKDLVVSVEQTLEIADILKKNHVRYEVYVFEGEGHGIKKSENIVTLLEMELGFLKNEIH